MVFQPGPGALAVMAGQVAGDHVDGALGVGLLLQGKEVLAAGAVAGRGAHGDRLAAGDPQPAADPGLLRAAGVLQRRLDPVPHRATSPARAGTCAGSPPPAHRRRSPWNPAAGRCRAPRSRSFRDELRIGAGSPAAGPPPAHFLGQQDPPDLAAPTSMPASRAARARVSRVRCAGPRSSTADSSPAPPRSRCPGGSDRAMAMMCDRRASVIRRLRPAPGRSPSPSRPAALNRCSQRRTVFWWRPVSAAIAGTVSPSQLSVMIRARSLQSAGACRAPASWRIFLAWPSSSGGRALTNFGTELASPYLVSAPSTHTNLTA